jgi:shikimate kinase
MALGSGELLALTGMMGAGKSTVARILAARLGRQVVSTDAMLESRFGKPVARIFAEDGEPAFRAAERAVIDRLDGGLVVDLGGGAFCDPHSAARLLQSGRVVFLDISYPEAARRLAGGRARTLAGNWEALHAERAEKYRRAHLTIAVDGLSSDEVATRILEAL